MVGGLYWEEAEGPTHGIFQPLIVMFDEQSLKIKKRSESVMTTLWFNSLLLEMAIYSG